MTKQKKGFWLFIFSLIPGAGEMYMGFKKQGLSIMGIFWLTILIASLNLGGIAVILPIIWFYSFFNVHNLKSLSEEEFYSVEDSFLLNAERIMNSNGDIIKKHRNVIAAILIFMGCSLLYKTIISELYGMLPEFLYQILHSLGNLIPRIFIALAIIGTGINMIRGKKKELDHDENA